MENRKVRDYMTSQVATLEPNLGMIRALNILLEHNQSAAPVVDEDNRLLGLISEADCMQSAINSSYFMEANSIVSDQMTKDVQTVTGDTKLVAAAEIFLKHKRRMLPVVEDDKLIGMLTRNHILRALIKELESKQKKPSR